MGSNHPALTEIVSLGHRFLFFLWKTTDMHKQFTVTAIPQGMFELASILAVLSEN